MALKKFYVGLKCLVKDERGFIMVHTDNEGDYWRIPGGRMDDDESFEETIRREVAEELPGTEIFEVKELQGAFRVLRDVDEDTSLILLYF